MRILNVRTRRQVGAKIAAKGYAEEKVVTDAGTWRATVTVRAAAVRDRP